MRGKTIDEHMIQGAKMSDVSVFVTDYTMYETCGRLYEKVWGKMKKVYQVDKDNYEDVDKPHVILKMTLKTLGLDRKY
ncbi:MAG: hypothetical protein ACLSBH_14640 [Coprobacillus cateniformis]